jgi:RNA polymerase sigma-54 factor
VKEALREIVSKEDKSNPLNDDQLREELIKAGFKISRRTVAKYRDLLGIEKANLRRQ